MKDKDIDLNIQLFWKKTEQQIDSRDYNLLAQL